MSASPFAVYVHTPFCPSKCGYCDFNSYAMQGEIMQRTTDATIREIRQSPRKGRPAKTIFFGGGTPTFLSQDQLLSILEAVIETHPPLDGCEITSESNPGTADSAKYAAMRRAGFNRISLGAQSFLDEDLIRLERVHKAGDIERAVELARAAGFDNLNLDLMFALPHQSRHAWDQNLERALSLAPEHLSLYCLTIEPNTSFYKKNLKGALHLPDDEEQVAMYEHCLDRTVAAGFQQYEISNFALLDRECRHNLCYWNGEDYAGYGPGAVGFVAGTRYTNLKHPERYSGAIESGEPLAFEQEVIDERTRWVEKVMLGLRLNRGIAAADLPHAGLTKVVRLGWVEQRDGLVRLTRQGRHFCSEVALELI